MPTKFVTNPRRPAASKPRAAKASRAPSVASLSAKVVRLAKKHGSHHPATIEAREEFEVAARAREAKRQGRMSIEGQMWAGMLEKRNPTTASGEVTPRVFLLVLRSKLTQHDAKLSAKQPNLYRLGHYLAAAERVEKAMGRSLDSATPAALEKFKKSLHKAFEMPFAPASAVERQVDAYLTKGTVPSLTRPNPSPFGEDYVEKVYGDWGQYSDVRAKELVSLAKAFGATSRAVAVRGSGKKVVVRFSKGSWWASVEAFNPFAEAFKAWDARRAEANTAWNRDNGPSPDTLDLVSDLLPKARRKNPPKGFRIAGPSVKTMGDGLRISKADAQRLKDMMDTGAPRILHAADRMMNGHGVERISGRPGLMYVNMGDTYDTTLIYDYKTNRFVVSSWGDIVERQPRRFAD